MTKRILITGAAGFIGFHVTKALLQRGYECTCLDNFNTYYDPSLKRKRASLLSTEVLPMDICESAALEKLIEEKAITHVVHLAAQAGVRHSLTHPYEYVDANMKGFVSLLESCKKKKAIRIVYASSSSVYGLNTKVPFAESDPTDQPANLYAASKKSNELIARAYHNLYGMSLTGLRYFTVYGPWGRPDMAYYSFCKNIVENRPIRLFNQGDMLRDFTYIDDIVEGTIAALELKDSCEIFNLGNHKPEKLLYLVELLERYLGKRAIKEFLPMQAGEVYATYADMEKSKTHLQFFPKTSLEMGLFHFVDWFCKYAWNTEGSASIKSSAIIE